MKHHIKNIYIPDLVVKHLTSTATDEDRETLNAWLAEKSNQKRYNEILRKIKDGQHAEELKKIDLDSPWKRIEQYVKRRSQVRQIRTALGYAAAILLPVLMASYLFIRFYNLDQVQTVDQFSQKYHPGSAKALLINEKGQVFELESLKSTPISDSLISIKNTGTALLYSKLAEKPAAELKEEYHRVIIPTKGEYFVELVDGTKIWVNSESEIKYPKHFIGNQRIVELKGEAYFEVAPNPDKPFLVKTEEGIISVLGTKFNVSAYEGEYNVTTLVEGGVSVRHRFDENSTVVIKPGEQAEIISVNHKIRVNNVSTYNYTAWKDNRFVFDKEPLESIFKKLSRWYGADFKIMDEKTKDIRITADIRKFNELAVILDFIENVSGTPIKFEVKDEVLYVAMK